MCVMYTGASCKRDHRPFHLEEFTLTDNEFDNIISTNMDCIKSAMPPSNGDQACAGDQVHSTRARTTGTVAPTPTGQTEGLEVPLIGAFAGVFFPPPPRIHLDSAPATQSLAPAMRWDVVP